MVAGLPGHPGQTVARNVLGVSKQEIEHVLIPVQNKAASIVLGSAKKLLGVILKFAKVCKQTNS